MPEPYAPSGAFQGFAAGKTLMPGEFISPVQIKNKGNPARLAGRGMGIEKKQEHFAEEIAKQLEQ